MISLLVGLAVIGFLVYLITTKIPMNDTIRQVIIVFVVICVVFYLCSIFGIADIPIPHLRH